MLPHPGSILFESTVAASTGKSDPVSTLAPRLRSFQRGDEVVDGFHVVTPAPPRHTPFSQQAQLAAWLLVAAIRIKICAFTNNNEHLHISINLIPEFLL